nr:phosphoinositide phosphatase SAC8 isoform X1 [Ipomoea batatas]
MVAFCLGTRMWRRGANLEGDTANFIETEQFLEFGSLRSSFLQVRGSIPLLWEQIVDLSYKPQLNIIYHEETPKVVERHFHDLSQRYGEVVALDLTDKDGVRQDAMDLISGRYTVNRFCSSTPAQRNGFDFHNLALIRIPKNLQYLPVASALFTWRIDSDHRYIEHKDKMRRAILPSVLNNVLVVTAGVMAIVKTNGRQFCSRPLVMRASRRLFDIMTYPEASKPVVPCAVLVAAVVTILLHRCGDDFLEVVVRHYVIC